MAIHGHHDTFKFFPSGGTTPWAPPSFVGAGVPEIAPRQQCNWGYQILPYIEQPAIYLKTNPWTYPVPLYNCPSRRGPTLRPNGYYMGDYGAVVPGDSNDLWGGSIWSVPTTAQYFCVIVRSQTVRAPARMASILDGTSNTLVITEKRLNNTLYFINDWHDDCGWADGWDPDVIRATAYGVQPDAPSGVNGYEIGSAHPAGAQGLLADGSVRLLSYSINTTVLYNLAHVADGQTIPDF